MTNAFYERLELAMRSKRVAPGELARIVGVAPSAVSGWLGGKRPSRKNLSELASALQVTAAWLEHGEGNPPEVSQERLAEEREPLFWWMRKQSPDGQRVLGDAASSSFDPNLTTIIREAAQNIRDARRTGEPTVAADFVLERLRGERLSAFLRTMRFYELRPHLEAVAEGTGKQARVVRHALEGVDAGELVVLRIEDLDGVGLVGGEYGAGNYSALVRNVMDTIKRDEGSAGSHGLGKSTIQRASAFGLLLFASNLSEAEPGTSKQDRRLVGRISLPWHEVPDRGEYAGPGWFGVPDPDPKREGTARSTYVSPPILEELRLSRPARTGTSILVVAAHDPSGETSDLVEMAREMSSAIALNFFAALVRQREAPPILRATVKAVDILADGREKVLHEEEIDPAAEMKPLVDLIEKARQGQLVEEMQTAGDVVERHVALRVPRRLEHPEHDELQHEAVLLVRQAADDEVDHAFANTVVTMRGAFMRVTTLKPRGLGVGVRPFFAVLLAGEAAATGTDDRRAELFLRTAEPPSHNAWKVTTELGTSYRVRGVKTMLDDFERAVLRELKSVVTVPLREPSDGPQSLRELLRLKVPPQSTARPRVVAPVVGAPRSDGAWELTEVTVQMPPKSKGWTFTPVLRFVAETGAGTTVRWAELSASSGCELLDGGRLRVAPGVKTAKFRGVSDPASHPIAAESAVVAVDVNRVVESRSEA
ncbi:helix-turn-helix domain-containing protein [Mumia sp. zg.B17]|uniref:helix-turn-helix domain-containing protein n=1 Tax=Mumia sp. zg.B17 TaxID=2855446 RepID=UPI001C6F3D30|nr:helix-turn-helix transcriptional regulator [Mumia sp. zg.B17]MBW9205379.1 helix-turn-helix domain-containing protein [Mumia sp. zg.B17]